METWREDTPRQASHSAYRKPGIGGNGLSFYFAETIERSAAMLNFNLLNARKHGGTRRQLLCAEADSYVQPSSEL